MYLIFFCLLILLCEFVEKKSRLAQNADESERCKYFCVSFAYSKCIRLARYSRQQYAYLVWQIFGLPQLLSRLPLFYNPRSHAHPQTHPTHLHFRRHPKIKIYSCSRVHPLLLTPTLTSCPPSLSYPTTVQNTSKPPCPPLAYTHPQFIPTLTPVITDTS